MKQWLVIFNVDYILQLAAYVVAVLAIAKAFYNAKTIKQLHSLVQACQQRISLEQLANQRNQHQLTLINSRIDMLETRFSDINEQQEMMAQHQQHQGTYRQASNMIQQGASVEEITTACDITRAEAELLMSLQGYQDQTA